MRKFLFLGLLLTIVGIMTTGCSSCQSGKTSQGDAVEAAAELETAKAVLGDFRAVRSDGKVSIIPEVAIAVDREWLYLNVGGTYSWFETEAYFEKSFSDSLSSFKVDRVRNIFHNVTETDGGYSVEVFQAITTKDGTVYKSGEGFVVGDYPINDDVIRINFAEAYQRLMESNIIKPDGHYCVLRKPVSKNVSHPVYIFGNRRSVLVAVDAVNGDVSPFLGGPLGEWP